VTRTRLALHHLTAALFALRGKHWYLSTGCLHGWHEYCRCDVGIGGPKTAGGSRCKWTGWDAEGQPTEPCRCACHRTVAPAA
jgi:hypothetical protein